MGLAHIGVDAKHLTGKVAESHDLITLCRTARYLGRLVAIAVHELDDTLILQEKVKISQNLQIGSGHVCILNKSLNSPCN
jgi:hypothetical protein